MNEQPSSKTQVSDEWLAERLETADQLTRIALLELQARRASVKPKPPSGPVTNEIVILERITHMRHISPNGCIGTEIELDSGKTVRVYAYIGTVEDIIRKAALGKDGNRG